MDQVMGALPLVTVSVAVGMYGRAAIASGSVVVVTAIAGSRPQRLMNNSISLKYRMTEE